MSTQADSDFFNQIAQRKGKLLRVEADREGETASQIVLTFDLGRVLLQPTEEALLATPIEERGELPGSLVDLAEEEPWWRLLGNAMTAVLELGDSASGEPNTFVSIRLRFREPEDNPRVVLMTAAGSAIRVSLEV